MNRYCPICNEPSSSAYEYYLDCNECNLWIDLDEKYKYIRIEYRLKHYSAKEFEHLLKMKAFL